MGYLKNLFEYYNEEVYLAHHGIKGQKWGIRRFQNSDGTLTDAGRARYLKDATAALDPKAKKEKVKYTASNGSTYNLVTTKGNVEVRKHVIEASKASKELSKIIDEAQKLNDEEEADYSEWESNKDRVRETTKSYLKDKNEKQIKNLEYELESIKNKKRQTDRDQENIEIISMDLDERRKQKITNQYVDEYIKRNAGMDFYSDMWSYEKKQHSNMIARDDRIWDLSQSYRKESEKYFKELLGEYGNQRIPTSSYGTTLSDFMSSRSGDAFWDLMWRIY